MKFDGMFLRCVCFLFALVAAFAFSACADKGDDDDDAAPHINVDDTAPDDDTGDDTDDATDDSDDTVGDDTGDDAADDDTGDDADDDAVIIPPTPNASAKADAFRLFYRERTERALLSLNRFGIAGDSVFATTFGKMYIAKTGDDYEVVPGPNDNNPIGMTVWAAWNLYKAMGGRKLELTLIRLFEGLAFNEAVSGIEGLTCREALPGWTRVMDGVNNTVARTRDGQPFTSPAPNDPLLEKEILDNFYDGVRFKYREDPSEYYFNFKAVNELQDFSITFVFDSLPKFLRISNCCSSWIVSKQGLWTGSYWGNHNSRDNFTDYALGYAAAQEAENLDGLPLDLALAAHDAGEAARRTCDAIVAARNIQMTVPETYEDYANDLIPGGAVGPDGLSDWQDLGSLSACQMAYMAKAMSSDGLSFPVPELPLPGAIETAYIRDLFNRLGITLPPPAITCRSLDDAFIGLGWGDILNLQLFGRPWYETAQTLSQIFPDLFMNLLGGMQDDYRELVLGAVGLCYYAQTQGDDALYNDARATLKHMVDILRIFTNLIWGIGRDADLRTIAAASLGAETVQHILSDADENTYAAALYSRMFGMDSPMENFAGFALGDSRTSWIESQLVHADSTPDALLTDQEIHDRVFASLAGEESVIQDRYTQRFGDTVPVRRAGDGYECIAPGGGADWMPTETPHHFWFGNIQLWKEAYLCDVEPHTLDCSWARLGCAPADLDASGAVDNADQVLFDAAWAEFGEGAACTPDNNHCNGADLDGSGTLDAEDSGYMSAAQGCTT